MSSRKIFRKLLLFLLTLPVYFFIFFPLLWLFSASLSNQVELFTVPPHWIPDHPTFQNYLDIFFPSLAASSVPRTFATALWNSIKIASAVTIICILVGSLAAYALARIPFGFNRSIQLGHHCHTHDPGSVAGAAALYHCFEFAIDQQAHRTDHYLHEFCPALCHLADGGLLSNRSDRAGRCRPFGWLFALGDFVPGGDAHLRSRIGFHGHVCVPARLG